VLTMPLLEGLDGVKKMSKSLGNFVGVSEPARDMFGKLMSISDELMAKYYLLLLGRELPKDAHPLEAKKQLAFEIVQTYHSAAVAQKTLSDWNADAERHDVNVRAVGVEASGQVGDVVTVVVDFYANFFGIAKSRSDARRLIERGSVRLNGKKIVDPKAKISLRSGQVLRLDKTHAVRIK